MKYLWEQKKEIIDYLEDGLCQIEMLVFLGITIRMMFYRLYTWKLTGSF